LKRYFGSIIDKNVLLSDDDQYHLLKVMRARPNDKIEVVSDEIPYLCQIKGVKPLVIDALSVIKEQRELPCQITLVTALLKGDKLDYVIQKATELGVCEIVLLSSERTIVKTKDYDSISKLNRYQRILKEAAEQSHRSKIPMLYRLISLNDLDKIKADIKMIAYEDAAGTTKSFFDEIKKAENGSKIAIIIGPEGGFTADEVKLACQKGYNVVSLGNRILRAETASIFSLSVMSSYLERK